MNPPLIGITVSRVFNNIQFYNQNPSSYSEAILLAGGLPLLIPVEYPLNQISTIIEHLDGLLLSGGEDIDTTIYAGEAHPSVDKPCQERDQLEIELFKNAIQAKKPVFGICRGIQLINVALGGTLFTHIPAQYNTEIIHNTPRENGRGYMAHEVELDQDSILGNIINQKKISVNSFHHQAIQTLASGLRVTARATDGLIEAVEMEESPFGVVGVQWHPECLVDNPLQLDLFKAFVTACQK